MKIAIDARYLSGRPSGIVRYSEGLLAALGRLDAENRYIIFVGEGYRIPDHAPGNFEFRQVPFAPLSFGTLLKMGRRIDEARCDLAHITFPVVPLRLKTPFVVTIHDCQPLTVPGFSGRRPWPVPQAYGIFYRAEYRSALRRARRVITNSQFTRDQVADLYPEFEKKIEAAVLGHELGVGGHSPPKGDPPADDERTILYVGSTRPNKQLPTLIRAFVQMRKSPSASNLRLVLALSKDRFYPPLARLMGELGLRVGAGEAVEVVEHVSEAELRELYRGASALAMATTHEGFGFPVLEAMEAGCPVVIAEHGSLPEIAGDAALRVPPGDAAALAAALARILDDRDLAADLIERGRERIKQFSWDSTAQTTLRIYAEAAAGAGPCGA